MSPNDCPDCGADDRLHEEIEEALADSALSAGHRRALADDAHRRALAQTETATADERWRIEAMPKRKETLLVAALAAVVLLIVGAGLMFMPGERESAIPGDRPEDVDVVRAPGEDLAVVDSWGNPKPYASSGEFTAPVMTPKPEALKKDPWPERRPAHVGVLGGQVRSSGFQRLEGVRVTLTFDTMRSGELKLPEGENRLRRVVTDDDGEFRFESLPPGVWRLTANHVGFAPRLMTGLATTDQAGLEGVPVVLAGEGAGVDDEVGAIEGTVTDAEGSPVAGSVLTLNGTGGGSFHTTRTDESGRYRVDRLLPGQYSVRCVPKPKEGAEPGDRFKSPERHEFTNVAAGKVARIDFTGSGTLTGVVLDAKGNPLAGVLLRIWPLGEKGYYRDRRYRPVQVRTDAEGRFVMPNAGTGRQAVTIQSTKVGNSFSVRLADLELDDGRDREVTLQLEESGIEGRISDAATGKRPPGYVHIVLYVVKPWAHAGTSGLDEEGRYRFRSVPPGKYQVRVSLRGYRPQRTEIDLAAGELRTGVDFELVKKQPGTVVFTVKDLKGKPVEGLMFTWNSEGSMWTTLFMDRGEPGVYTCMQLETGTFKVGIYRKDLGSKTVEVKVVTGETTKVDVVMVPRPPK